MIYNKYYCNIHIFLLHIALYFERVFGSHFPSCACRKMAPCCVQNWSEDSLPFELWRDMSSYFLRCSLGYLDSSATHTYSECVHVQCMYVCIYTLVQGGGYSAFCHAYFSLCLRFRRQTAQDRKPSCPVDLPSPHSHTLATPPSLTMACSACI